MYLPTLHCHYQVKTAIISEALYLKHFTCKNHVHIIFGNLYIYTHLVIFVPGICTGTTRGVQRGVQHVGSPAA